MEGGCVIARCPVELLWEILNYLPNLGDVSNFAATCKEYYRSCWEEAPIWRLLRQRHLVIKKPNTGVSLNVGKSFFPEPEERKLVKKQHHNIFMAKKKEYYQSVTPLPVVFDITHNYMKVGFGGLSSPAAVFPTGVAKDYDDSTYPIAYTIDKRLERHIAQHPDAIVYEPFSLGHIEHWDAQEKLFHYAFYDKLGVLPEEHTVALPYSFWCDKFNIEKRMQMMFETFNTPTIFLSPSERTAICATGRTTGLVVNFDGDGIYITPIDDYQSIGSMQRYAYGGKHISEYLLQLLRTNGKFGSLGDLHPYAQRLLGNRMRDSFATCVDQPTSEPITRVFTLPDDRQIDLTTEARQCTELLWDSSLLGESQTHPSLDVAIATAIQKSPVELRRSLLHNIVLCGDSSILPGLGEKLKVNLAQHFPASLRESLRVVEESQREHLVWCGLAGLVSSNTQFSQHMSKETYDESGPYEYSRLIGPWISDPWFYEPSNLRAMF